MKGTQGTLTVKKDVFLPWVANHSAVMAGTFSVNANLTKAAFR